MRKLLAVILFLFAPIVLGQTPEPVPITEIELTIIPPCCLQDANGGVGEVITTDKLGPYSIRDYVEGVPWEQLEELATPKNDAISAKFVIEIGRKYFFAIRASNLQGRLSPPGFMNRIIVVDGDGPMPTIPPSPDRPPVGPGLDTKIKIWKDGVLQAELNL